MTASSLAETALGAVAANATHPVDSLRVQLSGVSVMSVKRWSVLVVLALAAAAPAHAFRCGSKLVREGDTRSEVLAKCGDPVEVARSAVFRQPFVWIRGRPFHIGPDLVEVPVETWIYNLGPSRLMRRVRFEDGLVVEIETLHYGFREPPRRAPDSPPPLE